MPTPAHTLSWQGFSLTTPADWSLTHFTGNASDGSITLGDLHAATLLLQWSTYRHPDRYYAELLHIFKKNAAQFSTDPHLSYTHSIITAKSRTITLIATPTRLYRLTFPSNPLNPLENQNKIQNPLPTFTDHSSSEHWPWSLYGIEGSIPRRIPLLKAALHPGHPQLTFRRFRTIIHLGSWPLADQLLSARPLADWARSTIPLLRNTPSAKIESSTPSVARFLLPSRFLRPAIEFLLTHNSTTNTISWSQRPSHS